MKLHDHTAAHVRPRIGRLDRAERRRKSDHGAAVRRRAARFEHLPDDVRGAVDGKSRRG